GFPITSNSKEINSSFAGSMSMYLCSLIIHSSAGTSCTKVSYNEYLKVSGFLPKDKAELLCTSESTISTFFLLDAITPAKLVTVVVLRLPPLLLLTQITIQSVNTS